MTIFSTFNQPSPLLLSLLCPGLVAVGRPAWKRATAMTAAPEFRAVAAAEPCTTWRHGTPAKARAGRQIPDLNRPESVASTSDESGAQRLPISSNWPRVRGGTWPGANLGDDVAYLCGACNGEGTVEGAFTDECCNCCGGTGQHLGRACADLSIPVHRPPEASA